MPKKDLDYYIGADPKKAMEAMAKVQIKMEGQIAKLKEANREAKKAGKSGKKAGDDTAEGADNASTSLGGISKGAEKVGTKMAGMVAGYVSFTAAIAAAGKVATLEINNIKEAAREAAESLTAVRDLSFLGDFYKRHPNMYAEVGEMAVEAGLPGTEGRVEVSESWEMLESQTPHMTDDQRKGIMDAIIQVRRTTRTPMSTLINPFVQMAKKEPGYTPTQLANVFQQAKTESGSNTAEMALRMPLLYGIAEAAGLDILDAAALYAVASSHVPAADARTGLKTMLSRLQGKDLSEAGEKVKSDMGLKKGMNVFEQLRILNEAYEKGQVKLPQIQELFGEEASTVGMAMISDYKTVTKSRRLIRAAAETEGLDITGEKTGEIYAPGTLAGKDERLRRLKARKSAIRFEDDAELGLDWDIATHQAYVSARESGSSHTGASIAGTLEWIIRLGDRILGYEQATIEGQKKIDANTKAVNDLNATIKHSQRETVPEVGE